MAKDRQRSDRTMTESSHDVLTLKEAAAYLRLRERTVLAAARKGAIPAAKIGREWRFSRRQLLEWLEEAAIPEELVEQGMIQAAEAAYCDPGNQERLTAEDVRARLGR
jgi:excisionase family DNA binding protein